jgi:hypothetical protein
LYPILGTVRTISACWPSAAPQPEDCDVDAARIHRASVLERHLHQLVPAEDLADVLTERDQHPELLRLHHERLPVDRCLIRGEVDHERPDRQRRAHRRPQATLGLHPRENLRCSRVRHGLREVVELLLRQGYEFG